ncbi:RpiB/LacA/LacB family sugar-phosphate isomerase, partial [Klebsiella pneumoniae]|uniref:RpiB/LacA/LacB family sugar-phosphate isomerase n=1 Tax=Klebsiella pneumoniae TaxID=573 RepID=UPI003EE19329
YCLKIQPATGSFARNLIYSTKPRKSNNAQIITLGARVIGAELGKKIIQAWLESEYEGGGSAPKVERIDYYEHQHARD